MEKLRKTVKIGKTVYDVKISDDGVEAEATTFPLAGYGNCYVDGWEIELNYSKGWARVLAYGADHGWARRGSMENSWIDSVGYVRRNEAKKFIDEVREALQRAEDGTPDVKEIFDRVKDFVESHLKDEY